MKHFIVIAGAPGSGKSSVATLLQRRLDSPLFEFGWIPEFRNKGSKIITYSEDEALAFENLMLVVKNYAAHGFKNVIVTDLENYHIQDLEAEFTGYDYIIATLVVKNEVVLKQRVLNEDRSSGYRNFEEAITINRQIMDRPRFPNESLIEVDEHSVAEIVGQLLKLL